VLCGMAGMDPVLTTKHKPLHSPCFARGGSRS
jgi:hypothetical protein